MAKEYAKAFYSSKRWQDCRNAYGKSKGWLCENCLRSGIYNPGEIVHHKIEISPVNINTPEIALAWDNLELLCRQCHAEKHPSDDKIAKARRDSRNRYRISKDGKVTAK